MSPWLVPIGSSCPCPIATEADPHRLADDPPGGCLCGDNNEAMTFFIRREPAGAQLAHTHHLQLVSGQSRLPESALIAAIKG